jgi:hypothetical protein
MDALGAINAGRALRLNDFAPACSGHAYSSDLALINSPEDIASMLAEHHDGVAAAQEGDIVN